MLRSVLCSILTGSLLLTFSPSVSAQAKADPKAQLKTKVTFAADGDKPISEMLAAVSKQSKLDIKIDKEAFAKAGAETPQDRKFGKVNFKDVAASKVLTDVLKLINATYRVEKDHILIVPLK